jgi:TusA-related sulfurtransferase
VKLLATDRGARADVPAWADDTGNELVASGEEDGALVFYVRKSA